MDIAKPERPLADAPVPPVGAHREALDSADMADLHDDPGCEDAKADIGSDESFPASDPSAPAQPGSTGEPVPSSGFKE